MRLYLALTPLSLPPLSLLPNFGRGERGNTSSARFAASPEGVRGEGHYLMSFVSQSTYLAITLMHIGRRFHISFRASRISSSRMVIPFQRPPREIGV